MSASQDGSQVLGLLSSAFFSAMGVGGAGLVCGCGAGGDVESEGVELRSPGVDRFGRGGNLGCGSGERAPDPETETRRF